MKKGVKKFLIGMFSFRNRPKPLSQGINEKFKKYLKSRKALIGVVFFVILGIVFLFLGSTSLALLFFILTILSFVPTMAFPMIGSELGLTSALILGSIFGWKTGFIVGTFGNIIGRIVTFDIDLDFLYDFFLFFVAIIASFFPLEALITIGPIIILLYCIGALVFWIFIGALDPMDILVAITSSAINIFVLIKAIPILQGIGFG